MDSERRFSFDFLDLSFNHCCLALLCNSLLSIFGIIIKESDKLNDNLLILDTALSDLTEDVLYSAASKTNVPIVIYTLLEGTSFMKLLTTYFKHFTKNTIKASH